jgi:hypothetical protein
MLLYLSSNENVGIFDFLADEQGMIIKKLTGTFQLKQFVVHDMRSLNHYTLFAIDLNGLKDTEDEIIEAVIAFRSMYTSRVIFFLETKEGKESLVQQLIDHGIYNIVCSDEIDLLKKQIVQVTSNLGMSKKEAQLLMNNGDIIGNQFKPDYSFLEGEIKIAVTGVDHKSGTTTMAMNLSHYLSGIGAKVCYVEANDSGHLKQFSNAYPQMIRKDDVIICNGICFMGLNANSEESFNFIIYDMGVVDSRIVTAIQNKCDVGLLCSTGKPYELASYEKAVRTFEDIDISTVFSFVHELEQRKYSNRYGKIYFSEYTPSLFDGESNGDLWQQILNKYIIMN